jgi:type VI secretion system secreted protein VgrG
MSMADNGRLIHDLIYNRQHNRILRLFFPHGDAPDALFLVNKLDARETMSMDFDFTVELLSDNADIPLKEMQGKLLNIELIRRDGAVRYFSGYVFSFRRCHSDGSITTYEARLGPWLRFLSLRKDNYLFHNKTLREQMESIFSDYSIYPRWEWRVIGDDARMTDACQFDETDFNYLSRRWEAAGWHYWYEHDAEGHKLIVGDDSTQAAPIDGDATVRFHGEGGSQEEDAIDRWSPVRQVVSSSVAVSAFNFKSPTPAHVVVPTLNAQGSVPDTESYEYTGAYGFRTAGDGDMLGRIRMEEIEGSGKWIEAEGNNRCMASGRSFRLTDHFNHDAGHSDSSAKDMFLILSVRHLVSNNYLQKDSAEPRYRNWLTCTRRNVPWRPGRNFNSLDTRILAPQTATVVGPANQNDVHTDEYGRVRVQFHWDRVGNNDDRSSAWIRLASAWSGAELGVTAIPRVGAEVIVQWLDGNPDRPIVMGSVFNARNMPPWTLPAQHALTGLRSRELAPEKGNAPGGRGNHLVLDDTNERIQAQLKSDHQCSQLSLGHITRIDDTSGRKNTRGEGWELATDAWGTLRAGKGMLITTDARTNAEAHTKDLREALARLTNARQEQEVQAKLAEKAGAQEAIGHQADVARDLEAQHDAIKGSDTSSAFPELAKPALVLASPAGVAIATSGSAHVASNEHTAITSGKNVSIAASHSFFATVRQTLRLFAHKAGMKLIAAAGDIDVHALSNSINLLAKLNIRQTANRIVIEAKDEVVINGGGSYATFGAKGIEFGTPRSFTVHASLKNFDSGKGRPAPSISFPIVDGFDEQFRLVDEHEQPMTNCRYMIKSSCGNTWEGVSDAQGFTQRVFTNKPSTLEIEIMGAADDR